MINGTAKECPNCGYNEAEEVKEKSSGRKKKALALGGVGVVAFFVLSSVIPGPSIIGSAVGALAALPFISWGGLIAFYYNRKESKSEQRNAADLSKGREQNKTKEWREMEKEQRKAMLNAAAEGVSAVGEAASSYAEKKKKDQEVEQLKGTVKQLDEQVDEAVEYAQDKEQEAEVANQRVEQIQNSQVDVPKKCPICGAKWSAGWGSGSYTKLGPETFQCTSCDHTKDFS
jgi:excinuclease UvrABC ATPase subunit